MAAGKIDRYIYVCYVSLRWDEDGINSTLSRYVMTKKHYLSLTISIMANHYKLNIVTRYHCMYYQIFYLAILGKRGSDLATWGGIPIAN